MPQTGLFAIHPGFCGAYSSSGSMLQLMLDPANGYAPEYANFGGYGRNASALARNSGCGVGGVGGGVCMHRWRLHACWMWAPHAAATGAWVGVGVGRGWCALCFA